MAAPLWYLYMLIGIYFIIPILNSWLEGAKKREIQVFLGIWVISLVIPYLKMLAPLLGYTGNYGNMGLFGVCDWNVYGTFYYVSGFIGYIIPDSKANHKIDCAFFPGVRLWTCGNDSGVLY